MSKLKFNIFIACVLLMFPMSSFAEKAPQQVYDLANSSLAALGTDPVIIKAVEEENAKAKTLDQIKQKDESWKSTAGIDAFKKSILDHSCSNYLRELQNNNPSYVEIFVMDNLGANVAMTDTTSDYWQGDEAKFKNSFDGGKGAVFVDDVEFDSSSQAYLTQVSVPVMQGGQAIGAITVGIDIDQVK